MTVGMWFAYVGPNRCVPLTEVASQIFEYRSVHTVSHVDGALMIEIHDTLTGRAVAVNVDPDSGPHVGEQARELAQNPPPVDPGVPEPNLQSLHDCDNRYVLAWNLAESDETYNVMVTLAEIFIKTCDAIVYDVTNGRFV